MFRDEYTNFSFNELESENFKVWITNKNDLKRNMSPNFSDKFNTPTGSQIRYHEGTTIDKQDFKLSCAAIDVTLNEWRAITEWLSPLKQGKLRFEWNDNYYYMVKISKAPSGTMFMKGRVDNVIGQLYVITFDLEFTTVHDWAALGNYAEQNSIKEIDMSVYNNEYYMPSIIMRDKYIYRTALKDQTLYPSGDVVIVSSGNANDFALLDSDTDGIDSLAYNKIPLPTTITFKHGLAPVIAFWDYNQGSYSQPMTICADTLGAMEDIIAEVRTNDFVIRYSASYDIDKNVVLTLYTEGIIDDYENKFVLINVIDNTHPDYKYPKTDIIIDKIPVTIYVGETYTIKAQAYNTLKNINWSGTTGINIYPQEDGCKFSIPADWNTSQVINIVATVVETHDETVTEAIFGETGMYAQEPALIISSDRLNLGVDETAQLHAEFYGLNDTYFEWIIKEEDLGSVSISDLHSPQATITGLKPDIQVELKAVGRTTLSSDINDVISNSITIVIKNSTVELIPESTTTLRLGQNCNLLIDVIGEPEEGFLSWTCETNPSIREKLEFEVTPADSKGDRNWTIKSPYTLTDIDGNELMETTCTATVVRTFTDDREENIFSSSQEFTWFKGIEIQNINSLYSIPLTESGDFNITNIQLTDCIKYNYFSDASKYDTVEWSSSDANIIAIHKLPDGPDGNIQMTFNSYGDATITCTLKKDGIDVDSTFINVEVIEQNVFKWSDKNIIHYQRDDEWKEEIRYTIFDFELDDIINNIVQKYSSCVIRVIQRKDGWYELAYFPESYNDAELQVYVNLEGCGFKACEDQTNINSIKELLTFDNSYDAAMRVNNGDVIYYIPNSEWRDTTVTEINLKTFLDYYINKVTIKDDYGYLEGLTEPGLETLFLNSVDFKFSEDEARTIQIYYPDEAKPCYGYVKMDDKYQIIQFSSSKNNYCEIELSEDFGNEGNIVPYYYQPYGNQSDSPNAYFKLINGIFYDRLFNIHLNTEFFGTLQSETTSITITNGIISWNDGHYIIVESAPSIITDTNDVNKLNNTTLTLEYSHHAINSVYEAIATPTKFAILRRKTKSLDFPNGGTPQLGVLSMENNIIGYVYNTLDKTYYRHYLADGTNYWDELIGTPSFYQFQSHPTYSLLNHNFQDSSDTQFNSALTLTLKANNNTVICNTGVFNMYPLFFIKGGCHIKDSLYEYYSFLTNTNMKNLFVTINSRTSTMLHNGYAIDGSYNSLGRPLFKDIKNENQLLISSGHPELLKAVLISDEEIEYSDQQTGRRIAKFLINSKPMYGLRNKFAMHIFNESFKDTTNIYNKTGYNTLSYYNTMNNIKHILIDSPSVTFEQEPGGWTMSVSYRSSDKGLSSTKFHDFIRHSKRTEETQYDEYSNVGSVAEIAPQNSFVYISVCDYKELDILSEGEDYSVGCQARGVI